tara:strand:+ start:108 stop:290 length:183 start_codon:yes stop_codon:yes gene_type:complete
MVSQSTIHEEIIRVKMLQFLMTVSKSPYSVSTQQNALMAMSIMSKNADMFDHFSEIGALQ